MSGLCLMAATSKQLLAAVATVFEHFKVNSRQKSFVPPLASLPMVERSFLLAPVNFPKVERDFLLAPVNLPKVERDFLLAIGNFLMVERSFLLALGNFLMQERRSVYALGNLPMVERSFSCFSSKKVGHNLPNTFMVGQNLAMKTLSGVWLWRKGKAFSPQLTQN